MNLETIECFATFASLVAASIVERMLKTDDLVTFDDVYAFLAAHRHRIRTSYIETTVALVDVDYILIFVVNFIWKGAHRSRSDFCFYFISLQIEQINKFKKMVSLID